VPVLVDAAAQLPPAGNLKRFIAEGADLVAFSGGKAIGGPQATGILCGRRDLVMAAALQHLDLDIFWEQWAPPASLIDKNLLKGVPQHGIGRPCKVGKEDIVGLLTALELFLAEGDEARHARWLAMVKEISEGLQGIRGASVTVTGDRDTGDVPQLLLRLSSGGRAAALALIMRLAAGAPGVHADPGRIDEGIVVFNPMCLGDGEAREVAQSVRAAF
jgi:L-seryl-tRNA(Ser) seleniumtransferase